MLSTQRIRFAVLFSAGMDLSDAHAPTLEKHAAVQY
jgi:hypothetical protein